MGSVLIWYVWWRRSFGVFVLDWVEDDGGRNVNMVGCVAVWNGKCEGSCEVENGLYGSVQNRIYGDCDDMVGRC